MIFAMKFRLALLGLFLLLGTAFQAHQLVADAPAAALGDDFYMVRYTDGSAELFKNLTQNQIDRIKSRNDFRSMIKTKYDEIVATVTQRIYDYQFYLSQLAAQHVGTAEFDVQLARVMDTFSLNMTNWSNPVPDTTIPTPSVEGWECTKGVYFQLGSWYLPGWSEGQLNNLRVIPVLNDRTRQVVVSGSEVDYGLINITETFPPTPVNSVLLGHSIFSMAYEEDNAWRFMTWSSDTRNGWLIQAFPAYIPPEYVPYAETPPSFPPLCPPPQ